MVECNTFRNTCDAMFAKIADVLPGLEDIPDIEKFTTLMCTTIQALIISHKYLDQRRK